MNLFSATTDDTGTICIFGQDKILKKTIKGVHEESVSTLAFSKDSKMMLTACSMGNVRVFFNDFEGKARCLEGRKPNRKYSFSADSIEPDLLIDNAHDMGCMSADFCKVTRLDRKLIIESTKSRALLFIFSTSCGYEYDHLHSGYVRQRQQN